MKIYINGKEKEVVDYITIENIIKDMALNKWVSVWVNGIQILEKNYSSCQLNENDHVKVIRILAGG